jgi:hypothetical protein
LILVKAHGRPAMLGCPCRGAAWAARNLNMATTDRIQITQHSSLGAAWFAGWLFTIGFLKLGFWMGLFGLVVWPYFLGMHFTPGP